MSRCDGMTSRDYLVAAWVFGVLAAAAVVVAGYVVFSTPAATAYALAPAALFAGLWWLAVFCRGE